MRGILVYYSLKDLLRLVLVLMLVLVLVLVLALLIIAVPDVGF